MKPRLLLMVEKLPNVELGISSKTHGRSDISWIVFTEKQNFSYRFTFRHLKLATEKSMDGKIVHPGVSFSVEFEMAPMRKPIHRFYPR